MTVKTFTLRWRHNECAGSFNHRCLHCLFNRLFTHRPKKTSKLRVTGLCEGNSPWPVNSPHKGPVTRDMFPFDLIFMSLIVLYFLHSTSVLSFYIDVVLTLSMRWWVDQLTCDERAISCPQVIRQTFFFQAREGFFPRQIPTDLRYDFNCVLIALLE